MRKYSTVDFGHSEWCWHPEVDHGTSVFIVFRRKFSINKRQELHIFVSADNRYNLYINEKLVGRGPCRGDLQHYQYEEYTLDLDAGEYVLSAEVYVYPNGFRSETGSWAELHSGGGFILEGHTNTESIYTPENWKCCVDKSRRFRKWSESWDLESVVPAPPMEEVNFANMVDDWKSISFDDSNWVTPKLLGKPCVKDNCTSDPSTPWMLTKRSIPQMRTEPHPIKAMITCTEPQLKINNGIIIGNINRGRNNILIDLGRNQTSMVHIRGNSGKGYLRIAYAESLFVNNRKTFRGWVQDDNAKIDGNGYSDKLNLDSGQWEYHSDWYRSGRYIEITVELSTEIKQLEFSVDFISYPFELKAIINEISWPELKEIYNVSWHTALCCAHEHYEDCPYWEQLQYVGDTRIQALISYAATGDGKLGRQAIEQFDYSRVPCGLTQSRYPSKYTQIIPGFSLIWILMINDYYLYFGDKDIIRNYSNGIRNVLDWFEEKRDDSTGLIGATGYWNITDWAECWRGGKSDRDECLPETVINLFYAEACRIAGVLFGEIGDLTTRDNFAKRQMLTINAVNRNCYDTDEMLYSDVPGQKWFSQHVNALSILFNAADQSQYHDLTEAICKKGDLAQSTLYFNFYLLEALNKANEYDGFENILNKWNEMLALGFTTFPERPDPNTRSDCHAWSSSPVYEVITKYFGVTPMSFGFECVKIAPKPGKIKYLSGQVPIRDKGKIQISWIIANDIFKITICPDINTSFVLEMPDGTIYQINGKAGIVYQYVCTVKAEAIII